MNLAYPATFSKLENGDVMARFGDVPEAITCGESKEDALAMAQDALTAALSSYLDRRLDIPKPSSPKRGQLLVELSPLVKMKLEIYQAMKDQDLSLAELAHRMNRDRNQIKRLLNLDCQSRIQQIESALSAVGKKLVVEARNVA